MLSRYDGVELLAQIAGLVLSPIVFDALGYFGSFGIRLGCTFTATLYLLVFIRDPPRPKVKFLFMWQ